MTNRIKKFAPYIVILFLAIVFLVSHPAVYSGIKFSIVEVLALPLRLAKTPLSEFKKIVFYRSIFRENLQLRNQIDALKRRLVSQEEALQENERLKRLLSFKNQSAFSLIAAKVIAKEPSNWESAVIIDKGKKDGVSENMAVITELGLAGRVFEVANNSSKVILINDPNFGVAALLQRSREEGIVSGSINGSCRMKYLYPNSDVKIGDVVITSGLSQEFPKGILIGSVADTEGDASGLSKNCVISPAVNISRLEEVLLVVP